VEGGILAALNCVEIRTALKPPTTWVCHDRSRRAGKPGSTAAKDGPSCGEIRLKLDKTGKIC